MLEIDMDFAKKVAVPAVANMQELGRVLQQSRVFKPEDVNEAVNLVRRGAGSDSVGVGIKTVLDCIFEARAGGGSSSEVSQTFSELMIEKIQELQP
jgi:vesicle-fusing ATPase